jgi:hypothetical protein
MNILVNAYLCAQRVSPVVIPTLTILPRGAALPWPTFLLVRHKAGPVPG